MYQTGYFETWEDVAKKEFGSEVYAAAIRTANPQITEITVGLNEIGEIVKTDRPVLPSNVVIYIPNLLPKIFSPQSEGEDDITLVVDDVVISFWSTIAIAKSLDGIAQVSFTAPFDKDNATDREFFQPFSYKPMQLFIGKELMFLGTMMSVVPSAKKNRVVMTLAGYSAPGILNDCTATASQFPLEFEKMKLNEIAAQLLLPFGITVISKADVGAAFERVAIKSSQKVLPFLIKLAQQRNLVITSSPKGELVFQKAISSGKPVATFVEGVSPLLEVVPKFNSQSYYSSITGIQPTSLFSFVAGDKFTADNPFLTNQIRPLNFKVSDVEDGSLKDAVQSKISRMFGEMCSYSIKVVGFRDKFGNLFEENSIVELFAPNSMVYSSYLFVVRSVKFITDKDKKISELGLVLPGAYSGSIPNTLPWWE